MSHEREAPACCGGCPGKAQEVDDPTRRRFLQLLFGIFALSWGAMTTLPIIQYLMAAKAEETGPEVTSVTLGKLDSLAKGAGRNFQFGSKPALIVRDAAGDLHAYSAICTHLGCTVQFAPDKDVIFCACHGGQYDAVTGRNIAGPPPKPLSALKAEVVNGNIVVSRPSPAESASGIPRHAGRRA